MKIFTGMVLLMFTIFYIGDVSAAVTYKSHVDYDYGFYRVTSVGMKPVNDTESSSTYFATVNYTNKNLTINTGDTVIWINYDSKDWPLTIINKQELWNENNSRLKWSYQKFNYTFTEPGTYDIYIKERDKFHQTIIVNPVDIPVHINGSVMTQWPIKTSVPTQVITPVITLTQTPIIPEKIPTNKIPGIGIIGIVVAILPVSYFSKRYRYKTRK